MTGFTSRSLGALLLLGSLGSCGGEDAVAGTQGVTGTGGTSSGGGTTSTGGSADTTTGGASVSATGDSSSAGDSGDSGADTSSGGSSTGGEPCRVDEDCIDDNVCTEDYCGAAGCTHDAINGQAAPTGQVEGDCQVILCVGGEPSPTTNDDDLPVDMNVCTDDLCQQGVPSNPHLPAGTPCNEDGTCDGMGTCSECISPDDCDGLPPDDDCQTRTCEDNDCGQVFTDADTLVDPQVPGDCQVLVCDGAGATVSEPDDGDLPEDGLECTTDLCDAGVPANEPLPAGTPCAAGLCDGAGACVGCLDAGDCGTDTFCRTYSCDDNVCSVAYADAGTPLPPADQADGNCLEMRCDGGGNAVEVADDDDVPADDGNDCTAEVCLGGNPDHPDLPIDTDCATNGGVVCDGAGTCVDCNSDAQCPSAPQCYVASCDANTCTNDVTAGAACEDGLFCTANDTCSNAGVCNGGANPCAGPDGDSNCSESCDEVANDCLGDDPAGTACSDGLFCTANDVCDGAGTCDGGGNPCAANLGDNDNDCTESCNEGADNCSSADPNGSTCNDTLYCTVTDTCTNGVCGGTGNPCTANVGDNDSDCTESCNEGANNCSSADPNGSTCNDTLYCTVTDTCTGGVCGGTGNPCTANVGDNDSDCTESCNEGANNCSSADPNGSACNDTLYCTVTDTCTGGVCGGTGSPCPGPNGLDSDCSESCNEGADNCTTNDPNNSVCSDGLFCTSNDRCNAGACVGGVNPCPGADGDEDCTEVCNENANACSSNDPNGSLCDDDCVIPGACANGDCFSVCCPINGC